MCMHVCPGGLFPPGGVSTIRLLFHKFTTDSLGSVPHVEVSLSSIGVFTKTDVRLDSKADTLFIATFLSSGIFENT